MKRAAGILLSAPDGKVLLLRRTRHDHPGTWAFAGGGVEDGETAEQAARREFAEELGHEYNGELMPWTRRAKDNVDFTTFLGLVDASFEPTLNDEHDLSQWIDRKLALSAHQSFGVLHPGVAIGLQRFDFNELDVAKAIRDGELTSPQRFANVLLVKIRITGTGASYRPSIEEYVWRTPEIFASDDMVERCNGLAVIIEHPPNGELLNTEEYRSRNVGAVMLPYLEGKEIWGIAKIYDMSVATLIEQESLSTSPSVVFRHGEGRKLLTGDGKQILIEGSPMLLDHIALLAGPGVWDRGGPLAGVESVTAADSVNVKLDQAIAIVQSYRLRVILRALQ